MRGSRIGCARSTAREEEDANTKASPGGNQNEDDRVLTREWHGPTGKRIAIPVRVEPKVYFAAERTFLVCFLSLFLSHFT
jgi:hypothetical protein